MDDAEVLLEVDPQGVALLTINRPQARNALNWAAQSRFAAHVTAVAKLPGVRALIITGAGDRSFASGGDLKELCCRPDDEDGQKLNRIMSETLAGLSGLPLPVIAAINGDAFGGGCELVTACDLRVASPHARFSFAQVRNGLTTGWGGTARLVAQIGQSRALDLLLTGRIVGASEALALGLVQRLAQPHETALEAASNWARELVLLPASALAALKRLVYATADLPLLEAQALESSLFLELWGAADHLEALHAFSDKRPPRFNRSESDG